MSVLDQVGATIMECFYSILTVQTLAESECVLPQCTRLLINGSFFFFTILLSAFLDSEWVVLKQWKKKEKTKPKLKFMNTFATSQPCKWAHFVPFSHVTASDKVTILIHIIAIITLHELKICFCLSRLCFCAPTLNVGHDFLPFKQTGISTFTDVLHSETIHLFI